MKNKFSSMLFEYLIINAVRVSSQLGFSVEAL